MKVKISFEAFVNAFRSADRYDDWMGEEGLEILWKYLTGLEEALDTEITLDVIALCCEFCIMSYKDFISEYLDDRATVDAIEQDTRVVYADREKLLVLAQG